MKITFRATMLTVLLTLITLTVAGLGYSSYRNARFAAKDLSIQILQQTSRKIDQQLHTALIIANSQGELNRLLLESGQYQVKEFPRLARYWLEVMRSSPRFTRISLGMEATGDWYYVRRVPSGKLAIGTLLRNPQTDKLELNDYWPEDFP
ncbi:MAG TPA: hypothetical protein VJY33_05690, partial [Isosphaeraceae bacterium]|nr:hypothetical protein [Isosphaeraceae bacterium]